jgi:large subunit ribosomal protein L24e
MERRRNRPVKYNRELVAKTLTAIKKIDKIRSRRQERFYEQRMLTAKATRRAARQREREKQINLLKTPEGLLQDKEKEKTRIKISAEGFSMNQADPDVEMSD